MLALTPLLPNVWCTCEALSSIAGFEAADKSHVLALCMLAKCEARAEPHWLLLSSVLAVTRPVLALHVPFDHDTVGVQVQAQPLDAHARMAPLLCNVVCNDA